MLRLDIVFLLLVSVAVFCSGFPLDKKYFYRGEVEEPFERSSDVSEENLYDEAYEFEPEEDEREKILREIILPDFDEGEAAFDETAEEADDFEPPLDNRGLKEELEYDFFPSEIAEDMENRQGANEGEGGSENDDYDEMEEDVGTNDELTNEERELLARVLDDYVREYDAEERDGFEAGDEEEKGINRELEGEEDGDLEDEGYEDGEEELNQEEGAKDAVEDEIDEDEEGTPEEEGEDETENDASQEEIEDDHEEEEEEDEDESENDNEGTDEFGNEEKAEREVYRFEEGKTAAVEAARQLSSDASEEEEEEEEEKEKVARSENEEQVKKSEVETSKEEEEEQREGAVAEKREEGQAGDLMEGEDTVGNEYELLARELAELRAARGLTRDARF